MKVNKTIPFLTAAVLSAAALPLSAVSVSAENAYAPGDVDMDGVVTGHDAAMVSRYLYVDPELLTSAQKDLADVNGDGTIDQADADWIHENQVYEIGDITREGEENSLATMSAYVALLYTAADGLLDMTITEEETITTTGSQRYFTLCSEICNGSISAVDFNLLDADGNGTVNTVDTYVMMLSVALVGCQLQTNIYYTEGRYDLNTELARKYITDANSSGKVVIGGNDADHLAQIIS